MKQAMADFFTGLPQLIATSGILGAGGEHIAQSAHNNAPTSQSQSQPHIPPNTTSNSTGTPVTPSGQPSQTTASNSQPSQTPAAPPSGPPPTLQTAQARIHNIMNRPPEQRGHPTTQADLGQAQQVTADHVQKLENQTTPLSDAQKKELSDAKAALARLTPPESPAASTQSSSGPPPPPQTPPPPRASHRPKAPHPWK